MASFRCSQCGCSDDTALGHYWSARLRDTAPLCAACDPKIHKWHKEFPRVFRTFLTMPKSASPRPADLASLIERLRRMEQCIDPLLVVVPDAPAVAPAGINEKTAIPGRMFDPAGPIPAYRPLSALART